MTTRTRHADLAPNRAAGARVLCSLVACALCCGCRPGSGRPLVIVVSGDTSGWIVPCGCASNQYGGLPRRASCLESLRAEADVLGADAGGALAGTSPYARLKFEAILQGEAAMGVAAHNVGAAEAALGPDYLRDVAARLEVPFVSANVRSPDGRLVAEPLRIVRAGGRRVALVGVLHPKMAGPGVRVDPPREAILQALQAAAGRYDVAIVLAYLPREGLRNLATELPEVDAVVGGPTGQPMEPERVGTVLVVSATNKGKFLARLDAPPAGSPRTRSAGWSAEIVPVHEQWPDEPGQLANLERYYEALGQRDFTPDEARPAGKLPSQAPQGDRIAGTPSCGKCHGEDTVDWKRSKHARAWESLVSRGTHVDPDCQQCHATGYGLPGGFVSVRRSPDRTGVGCEDCHGPSQRHVADPKVRTPWFGRARDRCPGCHDRENSPDFHYDKYWEQIDHGAPADEAPQAPVSRSPQDASRAREDRR